MDAPQWLGLLKWTLANSDGTAPSEVTPMSAEDKMWLEQVMKEAVKDEPAKMNEIMVYCTELLSKSDLSAEDTEDNIINKLEELNDIVEQVDMAGIFNKFGGIECLLRLLDSQLVILTDDVRAIAASVIGTVAQNNLKVQDDMFTKGVLMRLVRFYENTTASFVCNKALFAVSCVIRNHAAAEEMFVQQAAASVLQKALTSSYGPLASRALFLSSALITSDYATENRISRIVETILPILLSGAVITDGLLSSIDCVEKTLHLLLVIIATDIGFNILTSESNGERVEVLLSSLQSAEGNSNEDLSRMRALLHRPTPIILYPTNISNGVHTSPTVQDENNTLYLMPPPTVFEVP